MDRCRVAELDVLRDVVGREFDSTAELEVPSEEAAVAQDLLESITAEWAVEKEDRADREVAGEQRGVAALRRALELRAEVEKAVPREERAARETLDELFDLVRLAMS